MMKTSVTLMDNPDAIDLTLQEFNPDIFRKHCNVEKDPHRLLAGKMQDNSGWSPAAPSTPSKLMELIEQDKIKTTEILMSNLRNKAHREKEEIVKQMFTDHPRINLFFCSSHAKAFSCRTAQGN